MISEVVYLDRDNAIDLLLKADGVAQDLSAVTRMAIAERDGLFVVDSSTSPGVFDWNTGTVGKIVLALGGEDIPIGIHKCRLIVYDPTNDDGIVWGNDPLMLTVTTL